MIVDNHDGDILEVNPQACESVGHGLRMAIDHVAASITAWLAKSGWPEKSD